MRQIGYLAAAGIYALDHHVERLKEDHAKAQALARELRTQPAIAEVFPVETNIVVFRLAASVSTSRFLAHLEAQGVRALAIQPQTIRLVFHLEITDGQMDQLAVAFRSFPSPPLPGSPQTADFPR